MPNPNDKYRTLILQWFYDRNSNATSKYGKKGSAVKISDIKKSLKEKCGLTQNQVQSNLTYLIDKNWINETETEKTIYVNQGERVNKTTWYEISSDGIDKIEVESEFQENPRYAGININATGSNIITMGDGNIINTQFQSLHNELTELKKIVVSSQLSDKEKLDVAADIETLKDQLIKPEPDKTIIGHLWSNIKKVAEILDVSDKIIKIAPLISTIIGC
ncbi:TPA: hypothetical protein GDD05_13060 [Legionella pneumophila]|jgi:hypothetical protein|uniref:hypothetical protein n=1 Tax=Legionella pneumophila TaxID=446 RepID=UPI0010AB0AB7|nr:hypothetical protein [Legionella pneumophila]TIG84018.1 hypothetical protein DI110_12050 [Legionella pneumophila]HAT8341965.1 hypothetical protein [Legionella pneumophila]HAT8773688.1 hypothetical protein [Legionella pneumophila]HAU2192722.1 hypothetical protein [Legionella pneumophila]